MINGFNSISTHRFLFVLLRKGAISIHNLSRITSLQVTRVRAIFYQTFHRSARTEHDVIKLMVDAVENIKPICEVKKVRRAGAIYDVPGIVAKDRQQTLAICWILEAAFKRRISYKISLEKCSFAEILDAYRKRGIARKKRENLHGLSSTNRSFAYFRWW